MCMSTVYEHNTDGDVFLYRNIANVEVDKDKLIFVNILGEKMDYSGVIRKMDFINNLILVEKKENA